MVLSRTAATWVALLGAANLMSCGPGIPGFRLAQISPIESQNSQYDIVFSSRTALGGAWNQTPNPSENIWSIKSDGSQLTALTANVLASHDSRDPVFSPDGRMIAFQSRAAVNSTTSSSFNIWTMQPDGSGLRALTQNTNSGLNSYSPVFSPDCRTVLFRSTTALDGSWNGSPAGSSNIWSIDMESATPTPLTQNSDPLLGSMMPTYSPDGSRIAFSSYTALDTNWNGTPTGSLNIWTMKNDGSELTPLTQNTLAGLDSHRPIFSPNGSQIVFHSSASLDGNPDGSPAASENIWIANVDGSGLTPLTRNETLYSPSLNPTFTPDGAWIIFQSRMHLGGVWDAGSTTSENLWMIRPDGSELKAITQHENTSNILPIFTPDGAKIVFFSRNSLQAESDGVVIGAHNLWIMNPDGSSRQPLTKNISQTFNSSNQGPASVAPLGACGASN